jgi:hypothetical protein
MSRYPTGGDQWVLSDGAGQFVEFWTDNGDTEDEIRAMAARQWPEVRSVELLSWGEFVARYGHLLSWLQQEEERE